jgi:DNA-binding XRE family transcriptional regulator
MKTIRALRQARGWTQFELALAVGVQPQTVYLWESGRRLPQVVQMRKLGEVFELCSDEIELGPPADLTSTPPHRARGARRAQELSPERDRRKRATRSAEGTPASMTRADTSA